LLLVVQAKNKMMIIRQSHVTFKCDLYLENDDDCMMDILR